MTFSYQLTYYCTVGSFSRVFQLSIYNIRFILFIFYNLQTVIDDVDIIRGNQNFNPLIFFPPAIFDMISTSLMYIGLNMTTASSFQMLRGKLNIK